MVDYISDAKIIEIIDSIYGTMTGDTDWTMVTSQVSQLVPFSSVVMYGHDRGLNHYHVDVSGPFDEEYVNSYLSHYHTISPWVDVHDNQKTGAVYTCAQLGIDLPRDHAEFFNDWVIPAGKGAGTAIKLFGQADYLETLNFDYAFGTDEKYSPIVVRMLATLRPHLRRALDVKRNLTLLGGVQNKFHSLLQQLPTPALLLKSNGRVEWMNNAASDALKRERGIRLDCKGKLLLDCAKDCEKLDKLVSDASVRGSDDILTPLGTFAFHARNEPEEPNLISVTPVQDKLHGSDAHLTRFFTPGWRSLAIIQYRADKVLVPTQQLQKAFGLTRAEALVVQALCRDMNTDEIAAHLSLKPNTVRNQIKRALIKTDSRRQSEMVRLVTNSITFL